MNRYDLHVARNQFDEFVKVELAPNGGWVMYQDAAARIAELEAALRNLDDMIVDLDAGHMELHQVSRFINAALAGSPE